MSEEAYSKYNFSADYQELLIACLLNHPDEFGGMVELVEPTLFNGVDAFEVMAQFHDYYKKYGSCPNATVLGRQIQRNVAFNNPERAESARAYLQKLAGRDTTHRKHVRDTIREFACNQRICRMIGDMAILLNSGTPPEKLDLIARTAKCLEPMQAGEDMGIHVNRDWEKVVDGATRIDGVHPGYGYFKDVWPEGWGPGWLVSILAPSKRFKCLGRDTPVMMHDGSVKAVQDIRPGDLVMGDDAQPRTVRQAGRGFGPLYRVRQANGDMFVCNDAHVLCLKSNNGRILELSAREYAGKSPRFRSQWAGYQREAVDFAARETLEDPYSFGLNLAAGEASPRIPDAYLRNERKTRLKVLAGFVDGAGTLMAGNRLSVAVGDRALADDVCWLARSLGFMAGLKAYTLKSKEPGCPGTIHRIRLHGNLSEIPVRLPQKRGTDHKTGLVKRRALGIQTAGDGDFYGFTVDGNGRFVLGDFTVTHNTTFCANLAINMAVEPYCHDVIYYACELNQVELTERILMNLSSMKRSDMRHNKERFKGRVSDAMGHVIGNVLVKSYPSKGATIATLRAHAQQAVASFKLKPRAIFIDFAETIRPDSPPNTPDHRQQSDIYTQARAFGHEFGACVVMPDRANREGITAAVPRITNFQGAIEKAGIADIGIGLCQTEKEHQQNTMRYFVFINRHGPEFLHFQGVVDPETAYMSIDHSIPYDPEEAEAEAVKNGKGRGKGAYHGSRTPKMDDDQRDADRRAREDGLPGSGSKRHLE